MRPYHRKRGNDHDGKHRCGITLAQALAIVLGTKEIPLRLRAWDGSEAGPAGA
ncbi:hypothetical protein RCH07_002324, partial [Arthrobacter sp. CG_A4]|nr:hypothetical protein [Arthrobacter sp. CG_A4]